MRTDTTVDALSWRKSGLLETCERAAKKIRSRRSPSTVGISSGTVYIFASAAEERALLGGSGIRGHVEQDEQDGPSAAGSTADWQRYGFVGLIFCGAGYENGAGFCQCSGRRKTSAIPDSGAARMAKNKKRGLPHGCSSEGRWLCRRQRAGVFVKQSHFVLRLARTTLCSRQDDDGVVATSVRSRVCPSSR
jgi:hypothetical protein